MCLIVLINWMLIHFQTSAVILTTATGPLYCIASCSIIIYLLVVHHRVFKETKEKRRETNSQNATDGRHDTEISVDLKAISPRARDSSIPILARVSTHIEEESV